MPTEAPKVKSCFQKLLSSSLFRSSDKLILESNQYYDTSLAYLGNICIYGEMTKRIE